MYVFVLAVLVLVAAWAFCSSCMRGLHVFAVCGLLPAGLHLAEHGLLGAGTSGVAACGLSECSPQVLEHRLCRCSWPQGDLLGGM